MTQNRKAFTMVELIFVIVIIGILSAIAMPKLAATRDDAVISRMVVNEKRLLHAFQAYYTSQSHSKWVSETIDKVISVPLDVTSCGTPATVSTQISPNTFLLCHDNVTCLSFRTIDDGNLSIANGTDTSDPICEAVKAAPATQTISNRSYQLAGLTIKR